MLVRANRVRITYADFLSPHDCPHRIRNNPILCKISAADDIAGSCRGNSRKYTLSVLFLFLMKERFLITVRQNLRTGLGIGVGIEAVQFFFLRKGMMLHVIVLINLIRRHIQNGTDCRNMPNGFQQIHGSHNIGFVGFSRKQVGLPDNRLCCQVKNQFRSRPLHQGTKLLIISDIPFKRVSRGRRVQDAEEFPFLRGKAVSIDFRSQFFQKKGEPGAFETVMPGYKDTTSLVKFL